MGDHLITDHWSLITDQRARVAALARAWIGLPYYHGQRLRGVGGDCTFFVLVYEDAGLIPPTAIPAYSPEAHLHSEAGVYEQIIRRYASPVEVPGVGDVVLYKFGRTYSHGGVIVDPGGWAGGAGPPLIAHGDMVERKILLAEGDGGRLAAAKGRRFFTLWP
jgi:cell wall-associated NlpC family hydrolase